MTRSLFFGVLYLPLLIVCLSACQRKSETLFRLLHADQTGITFNNSIQESDTFNILTHEYLYNGGGVGIADFNNDGLQDIFFTGNLVPNRLYLNKGNLEFGDISKSANIEGNGKWNSGVAIADINKDGWMDIYVCATMHADSADRRNMLFINNGVKDGGPSFTDQAAQYGLEHGGYSVAAAFLDYDRDEDLDLYLLVNQRMDHIPTNYREKITDGSAPNNDRLFRNNNDGTFTDVTLHAGITLEGFGLGLSVSDLNMDGWPDIYVSNDYLSNDILYVNNQNGTFTNRIAEFVGHQSQFSMGNDAADMNNDGMPDIITTDMLPETSFRKKTTIGNKSYLNYINNEKYGYEYQYVRNMLHLNRGLDQKIKFSEIGQLAGIQQTEWSWSPLFADFDNDGNKDLVITNGFPKDITDKDFANYRAEVGNIASIGLLEDSIPVVKIPNYIFRNNGDLTFNDVTKEWGLTLPSFSNGAAFADLDNDGDLDYVINNINSEASVYENTLYSGANDEHRQTNNFLRLVLMDPSNKKSAVGAKVRLYAGGSLQFFENTIYRGFLSSVENIIHFGLGSQQTVDSVLIQWPDGNIQKLTHLPVNKVVTVTYEPSSTKRLTTASPAKRVSSLVTEASLQSNIRFKHYEDDKIDFNLQRTLPHKFTQSGPGMAVGDINSDGLEDLVIGGSTSYSFSVFIQDKSGAFHAAQTAIKDEKKKEEDAGLLLFDADNDKDLDLYIVSGSIESYESEDPYQDRLLLNDGKGKFKLSASALPDTKASGSCVRASDFDADGDLDLFVGGRVIPGQYPSAPKSYLLMNEKGVFKDVSAAYCPAFTDLGMITDALWTDFNGDQHPDLIAVGEFTSVMFFENTGRSLQRVMTELDEQKGWWNSITSGDFDLDGDTDYVVGNLGLNNAYEVKENFPLKAFAKDFDGNGSMDAILACYMRESMTSDEKKLFPVHFWDELNTQSPKFRNKFSRYRQYGESTMNDVLDEQDLAGALILEANQMASAYVENRGGNRFTLKPLPVLAQIAPVNGLISEDVNMDGYPDVVMVGNDYGNEVFTGRYDAFNGLILFGDGRGNFNEGSSAETGFYVPGDAKALVKLSSKGRDLLIASQNKDSLRVFSKNIPLTSMRFVPEPLDTRGEFIYADGKKQTIEFNYGSGYLSQSSRSIVIPDGVREVIIYNSRGESRKVSPGEM
jgi:enediyne biosynthesis protein E4